MKLKNTKNLKQKKQVKKLNEEQFKILTEKLDFISKMLLLNIVKDLEFSEQVTQLSNLGLKETEIAKILNSTRDKVHSIMRKTK